MPSPRRKTRAELPPARRRDLLGGLALGSLPGAARGQAFPDRPLRVLFGFPAGSTPDVILRVLAQGLQERLGQAVVVENRSGATGLIAAEAVARASADGHTMLLQPHNTWTLPALRRNMRFDPVAELQPVAGMARAPLVLVVPGGGGVGDLAGFLAEARQQGDRLAYGMSGAGASPHLAMALLSAAASITPTAIVYRGDPEIIAALLGGQIQAAFLSLPTAAPLVRQGQLRALGVTTRERAAALPDVPTMAEAGQPGVELASWWALSLPRDTPAAIRARLIEAVGAVRQGPLFRARLEAAGALPLDLDGDDLNAFAAAERDRQVALFRSLGLQPE